MVGTQSGGPGAGRRGQGGQLRGTSAVPVGLLVRTAYTSILVTLVSPRDLDIWRHVLSTYLVPTNWWGLCVGLEVSD